MNDIIAGSGAAVAKATAHCRWFARAAYTNLNQMYEIYKCILVLWALNLYNSATLSPYIWHAVLPLPPFAIRFTSISGMRTQERTIGLCIFASYICNAFFHFIRSPSFPLLVCLCMCLSSGLGHDISLCRIHSHAYTMRSFHHSSSWSRRCRCCRCFIFCVSSIHNERGERRQQRQRWYRECENMKRGENTGLYRSFICARVS